jgi:lipopolysaccharide heptosyltransferase I
MSEYPRVVDKLSHAGGSPRVLIVRLSAIGDCVQTMPLAGAVRARWPEAQITWVVEKVSAPLVAACDAVDRIVVVPKGFSTSTKLLRQLRSVLSATGFDFALDPQGLTKSGLVGWLSGAKRRIGFARPAGRELNPWLQSELVTSQATPRVERYLELLRPLGIERPRVEFGLTLPAAAVATAANIVAQNRLTQRFAVLNPGAGWDSKRWPAERYAEVAAHLSSRGVSSLVVWAGPQENSWAQEIASRSQRAAVLAPSTSLLELAALVGRASLFVGSDTGPLHLAAAVNTPCVALFGASSGVACGPFGGQHKVLQVALDESPGRKRPGADNWAMRTIGVPAVCAACDAIVADATPTKLAPLAA